MAGVPLGEHPNVSRPTVLPVRDLDLARSLTRWATTFGALGVIAFTVGVFVFLQSWDTGEEIADDRLVAAGALVDAAPWVVVATVMLLGFFVARVLEQFTWGLLSDEENDDSE